MTKLSATSPCMQEMRGSRKHKKPFPSSTIKKHAGSLPALKQYGHLFFQAIARHHAAGAEQMGSRRLSTCGNGETKQRAVLPLVHSYHPDLWENSTGKESGLGFQTSIHTRLMLGARQSEADSPDARRDGSQGAGWHRRRLQVGCRVLRQPQIACAAPSLAKVADSQTNYSGLRGKEVPPISRFITGTLPLVKSAYRGMGTNQVSPSPTPPICTHFNLMSFGNPHKENIRLFHRWEPALAEGGPTIPYYPRTTCPCGSQGPDQDF